MHSCPRNLNLITSYLMMCMRKLRVQRHGLATISLGLSVIFAVGAFAYFALSGAVVKGTALGILVLLAGAWEYRRKVHDSITAETYEAKAEAQQRQSRR